MVTLPRIAPAVLMEHAVCIVCLFVVPFVLLRPAILGGEFPLDSDSIYYSIPWEDAQPEGFPAEDPGGPREIVNRYYPGFRFLNDTALAGDSVQWNPREGFGVPHLAQWRTRALSPFSIPYYLFDLRIAMTLSLFAKIAVAGLAAFMTSRILWLRPASALLAAVAYQLSPVFLLTWNAPMADAVAWFPFLIIMFERFGGGRTRVWPACALVFALIILGGDPESVVSALMLGLVYVFARSFFCGRGIRHAFTPAMVLVISAVAGAAMAAFQLIPFAEWIRQVEPSASPDGIHRLRLADLVMTFLPRWYGAADVSSIGGPEALRTIGAGFLFLSAPLCLAFPYWFAMRPELKSERRPMPDALVFASFAAVLLGILTGLFGTVSLGFLRFSPAHFWFPLSLWAAMLLGRSGEEWSRLMPDPCQDALKRFLLFTPVLLVLCAATILVSGPNPSDQSRVVQVIVLGVMVIAFIAVIAGTVLKPAASGFAYAAAAFVAIASIYAYGSAQPFRASEAIFPSTDIVTAFANTNDRIGGNAIAQRWPLSGNGIANAAVPEGFALRRQRRFEDALRSDPALLPRMGLRHFILRDVDLESTYAAVRDQMRIERSFAAGAFWVELLNALPHARLIYAARPAIMYGETPIASHTAPVVEGGPVLMENEPARGDWVDVYAAIGNVNAFDVDAAAPAVLVVSEAWYPGWKAYVDGEETILAPVDALFRGVPIAAGTHRVELYFDSQSFRVGRGISALATLIVLVAFIGRVSTAIRKRRRLR